jgi:ATP-binding cassette, subfamily B, bacterial
LTSIVSTCQINAINLIGNIGAGAMKRDWRSIVNPAKDVFSGYWRTSHWMLVLIVLVGLLSAILAVIAPFIFSRLIDRLSTDMGQFAMFASFGLYALILGVSSILGDTLAYLALMGSQSLDYVVATRFFDRVLKKTVLFFTRYNPTEIHNALAMGQDGLNEFFQLGMVTFVPGVTQIVLSLLLLGATLNLAVVAIVIVYGTIYVALTHYANMKTRRYLDQAMEASQENAKFVGNAVGAMETLRQFGSSNWMSRRFERNAAKLLDSWLRFCYRRVGYTVIFALAIAIEFYVTFVILWPQYRAGQMTIGDIVLFNAVLLQLNHPFEMISQGINGLVRSYAELVPFITLWSAEEEPDTALRRAFVAKQGRITFDNVSFVYEGGRGVEAVSFVAERGQVTYLVGETGAGKSTIFKLALKSLEPQVGRITIDGTDLADIARADWYSAIGVVPQEVILLNDTIETNILLGRRLDEARLRLAAERAAILDFVERLPDGFQEIVGERGLMLSGGERQRIAIARALYADPTILFLDEASSALDEATERDIMTHIRKIADKVTVIAITHRERVIAPSDRIVRLRGGSVVSHCGEVPARSFYEAPDTLQIYS